jgi:hypothetical protein
MGLFFCFFQPSRGERPILKAHCRIRLYSLAQPVSPLIGLLSQRYSRSRQLEGDSVPAPDSPVSPRRQCPVADAQGEVWIRQPVAVSLSFRLVLLV